MLVKKVNILLILLTLLSASVSAAVTTQYNATVNHDQRYLFGCQALSVADGSGVYSKTLGDSTVHLHLLFLQPSVTMGYSAKIEPGQTYLFGCQQLTVAGEYKDTLHLADKDSITILTLSVESPAPTEVKVGYSAKIEPGQTYLFGCQQLTVAGEYKDTLHLADKDSITILTLSVESPAPTEVKVQYDAEIEAGDIYLLGCKTY